MLSVVVPVQNEAQVLSEFHGNLTEMMSASGEDYEIIYVDDGSTDQTLAILQEFRSAAPEIAILELSRNFGKEVALSAGLDHARGEAVIVIDADMQDPPWLIHDFLREWREGYDVVYGRRTDREGEPWLKVFTAKWFYRVINQLSDVRIPPDVGDFRLLSRRAVDALLAMPERHRYLKGLYAWIGFPQKAVPYVRQPRAAGKTHWNYWRLWNFALEGITSFSTVPLRIWTYLGFLVSTFSFLYGSLIVIRTIVYGVDVPGYASLLTVVLFLGGIQLIGMGVLGEYIGRIYLETKSRPLYIVRKEH